MTTGMIRIIAVPPGDAPLWVREKWVGIDLPLAGRRGRSRSISVSVNVRAAILHHLWAIIRGRSETIVGFRVEAKRAVDLLEAASPEAAEWWRQNTPALLKEGRQFVFHGEACRLIDS